MSPNLPLLPGSNGPGPTCMTHFKYHFLFVCVFLLWPWSKNDIQDQRKASFFFYTLYRLRIICIKYTVLYIHINLQFFLNILIAFTHQWQCFSFPAFCKLSIAFKLCWNVLFLIIFRQSWALFLQTDFENTHRHTESQGHWNASSHGVQCESAVKTAQLLLKSSLLHLINGIVGFFELG